MELKVELRQDERMVSIEGSPIDVNNVVCPLCGERMLMDKFNSPQSKDNPNYYEAEWHCSHCFATMSGSMMREDVSCSVPHQLFRDYKINTFIDACDEKSIAAIEEILGDHAKEIRDAADKDDQKKLDSLAVEIKSEWAGYLSRSDKDFSVKLKIYEDKVMADAEETRKQTKKQKKTKSKKEAAQ